VKYLFGGNSHDIFSVAGVNIRATLSAKVYNKLTRFLHFSTDEVYGSVNMDEEGCDEEVSLLNPSNMYSASKAAAEFMVKSYYHSFKIPIIITRCNNVYGPYQYTEKLIPRFISKLLANEKCEIHGMGESRRNFIYADEADMLNVALFGITAKQWREANPKAKGNIRDEANIEQLVVLSNMESINAVLIHQGLAQNERIKQLNNIAITQMKSLVGNKMVKKLKS
jgi:dTDP-D-glucose 4,6-dehydratase